MLKQVILRRIRRLRTKSGCSVPSRVSIIACASNIGSTSFPSPRQKILRKLLQVLSNLRVIVAPLLFDDGDGPPSQRVRFIMMTAEARHSRT